MELLSKTEAFVLSRLAWGRTYLQVVADLNQERRKLFPKKKDNFTNGFYSLGHLYSILTTLRRKTQIKNFRDAAECRRWEKDHNYTPEQQEKGPTPQQFRVLYLLAVGYNYVQIQRMMKLSLQACANLACEGRKRAGITETTKAAAMAYIQKWCHEQDARDRLAAKAMEEGKFELPPLPSPVPPQPVTSQNTPVALAPDPMDDPAF